MNMNTKNPGRTAKILGFLGIGLCGLCCALPIIGIIGGAGVLGAIAVYAEKIAGGILVLSVSALVIAWYRKRKSPTCKID